MTHGSNMVVVCVEPARACCRPDKGGVVAEHCKPGVDDHREQAVLCALILKNKAHAGNENGHISLK